MRSALRSFTLAVRGQESANRRSVASLLVRSRSRTFENVSSRSVVFYFAFSSLVLACDPKKPDPAPLGTPAPAVPVSTAAQVATAAPVAVAPLPPLNVATAAPATPGAPGTPIVRADAAAPSPTSAADAGAAPPFPFPNGMPSLTIPTGMVIPTALPPVPTGFTIPTALPTFH